MFTGIDRIIDHVVSKLGGLQELTEKAQQMIDRKISYRCTTPQKA